MARRRRLSKRGKKFFSILSVVFITIIAIVICSNLGGEKATTDTSKDKPKKKEEPKVEEKLKILDLDSNTRPYAVMINNIKTVWGYQSGIQDAYLVYEIIVEGGITRMMALYKDTYPTKVGSNRSARHYFIDYAEENDAIFIHWGGSPQAYSRLASGIDSLDGMSLEGSVYFRDTSLNRDYEHTGFVNLEKAKSYLTEKGYRTDTNKGLLLDYSADEIDLNANETVQVANTVDLKYSNYHKTNYEYDEENKVYKRSMSGKANVDLETGEQYTAKNIIVYKVENYTLNDGEGKGRQELENIGNGTGYYISNGQAVSINWEKSSHSGQTVYKYANGEELTVNDGNTFIQILPADGEISIN